MTPSQRKCFDFIKGFWSEHQFGPTFDEIASHLGLKDRSSAARLVKALVREEVLVMKPKVSRSVRPASMPWPPE